MRFSNQELDRKLTDILAEARAIRITAQCGGLTYETAKKRVEPLLKELNKAGSYIAKKYGRKYRKITFQDL